MELDIPTFLQGRNEVLAAKARASLGSISIGAKGNVIRMPSPRQARRSENERLNRLADQVERAIRAGAVTFDALTEALADLAISDVRDGIGRARDRKRWAALRQRRSA